MLTDFAQEVANKKTKQKHHSVDPEKNKANKQHMNQVIRLLPCILLLVALCAITTTAMTIQFAAHDILNHPITLGYDLHHEYHHHDDEHDHEDDDVHYHHEHHSNVVHTLQIGSTNPTNPVFRHENGAHDVTSSLSDRRRDRYLNYRNENDPARLFSNISMFNGRFG